MSASVADFLLQSSSSTVSVIAGKNATIPLTVSSLGDTLSNQVQLSCSGLPTGAACQFDPSTVIPIIAGIPVTLTITTTGKTGATLFAPNNVMWAGLPFLLLLGRRLRRGARRPLSACLLFCATLTIASCGGGGSSFTPPPNPTLTPPGTYVITVIAAVGAVQRTSTISLTVTAQ
jgi:hypothetical protein